jgi:serine/threonine protein kinase
MPPSTACSVCGNTTDVLRFCPACGSRQPVARPASVTDPLVGRIVANRYEIRAPIGAGAMGRVYRGLQRALDREVAIKCIQPHLLSPDAASRFLREARAVSRLNHPNVVSVFDFGRTAEGSEEFLFLVMELLTGPNLDQVMKEGPFPIERIVGIVRQALAGLSETHAAGITHRDVKPGNIVLEAKRDGGELVKLVDFGIARSSAAQATQVNAIAGTPHYMAPEQAGGAPVGPAADLYAMGVLLFHLLTGRVPFDGPSATAVLVQHLSAPRPDPQAVAPERNIPKALADVCRRAMHVDPHLRYESAAAMSEAIERAVKPASTRSSLPPMSAEQADTLVPPGGGSAARLGSIPPYRAPFESHSGVHELPLLGRKADLEWAARTLEDRQAKVLAVCGRQGVGRSRMLREMAMIAVARGMLVLHAVPGPPRRRDVGFDGVRTMIAVLAGVSGCEPDIVSGAAALNAMEAEGLRLVFAHAPMPGGGTVQVRRDTAAALRWAAHRAVDRARGVRTVLVVDDADAMDAPSRAALDEVVLGEPIRRFTIVLSALEVPARWSHGNARITYLRGLSGVEAAELLEIEPGALEALGDDIEPLHVAELERFWRQDPTMPAPEGIAPLIDLRVTTLKDAERELLQALALVGRESPDALAAMLGNSERELPIQGLVEAGFAEVRGGYVSLAHPAFEGPALASATKEALTSLHSRRAAGLASAGGPPELQLFHGIHGDLDAEVLRLVEEVALLRTTWGDHEGAIASLWDGFRATDRLAAAGDPRAPDARIAIGQRLASTLELVRRFHEAETVLLAVLAGMGPRHRRRMHLLEQLSTVVAALRRPAEAEQLRRQALDLVAQDAVAHASQHPTSGIVPRRRSTNKV